MEAAIPQARLQPLPLAKHLGSSRTTPGSRSTSKTSRNLVRLSRALRPDRLPALCLSYLRYHDPHPGRTSRLRPLTFATANPSIGGSDWSLPAAADSDVCPLFTDHSSLRTSITPFVVDAAVSAATGCSVTLPIQTRRDSDGPAALSASGAPRPVRGLQRESNSPWSAPARASRPRSPSAPAALRR